MAENEKEHTNSEPEIDIIERNFFVAVHYGRYSVSRRQSELSFHKPLGVSHLHISGYRGRLESTKWSKVLYQFNFCHFLYHFNFCPKSFIPHWEIGNEFHTPVAIYPVRISG